MRALRFALFTATALVVAPAIAAAGHAAHRPLKPVTHGDGGITVPMDEARVVTFQKPVATLFVGNPVIADVTIIDARHAYVLGKTFGATNVIGLDSDHKQVLNSQIYVTNRMVGSVTLNRGAETYNYACTRLHCETNPRPGDPAVYVGNTEQATQQHEDAGAKAAAAASGASQ